MTEVGTIDRYDDLDFARVTVRDGVAEVRLARPERRNAFDAADHHELTGLYRRLALDPSIRAVVLTADGPVFCAGPHRDFLVALGHPDNDDLRAQVMAETAQLVHDAIAFDRPVVTALHGVANGMGLAFALLADIVVVEEHVVIRDGHVAAGLTAGDGGTLLWPVSIGLMKAKRYLLTSDPVTAAEAEQMGLVTEVVPTGGARDRAFEYATRLANGPQVAIRSTKRALNQWLRAGATTSFDVAWALELQSMAGPEARHAAAVLSAGGPSPMPADGDGAG